MNGLVARKYSTGQQEGRLLTEIEQLGIAVLSLAKHRDLLSSFGDQELRDLLHGLKQKGWVVPIERGKYLVVPRAARSGWHENPLVIAATLSPSDYYISYWSALSYHQLTEQIPRVVYVALKESRRPPLSFQGWDYRFASVAANRFYGFRAEEFPVLNGSSTAEVLIAEPEKAILDSMEEELRAGGIQEVVKALRRGLDEGTLSADRLISHAGRYPSSALIARIGHLLDRFGVREADTLLPLVRRRGRPVYMSEANPRAGARFDDKWHLWLNVPQYLFELEEVS